jgi:hypothetical protein
MSESEATADTTTEATDSESSESFDPARAMEKIKKANAEAKSLRARLKELEPLAQKAQEAEQAKLSETERFAAQLADVTRRAEAAETRLLRSTVARRAGLPDDLADRLQGATEDELEADAKRLAELFAARPEQQPARRGDPSQGSDPLPLNGDPLVRDLIAKLGPPRS